MVSITQWQDYHGIKIPRGLFENIISSVSEWCRKLSGQSSHCYVRIEYIRNNEAKGHLFSFQSGTKRNNTIENLSKEQLFSYFSFLVSSSNYFNTFWLWSKFSSRRLGLSHHHEVSKTNSSSENWALQHYQTRHSPMALHRCTDVSCSHKRMAELEVSLAAAYRSAGCDFTSFSRYLICKTSKPSWLFASQFC